MMIARTDLRFLVDLNASLNATAFVLIVAALIAIKRGNEGAHKKLMLTAAAVSALFLVSYATYHLTCDAVRFGREGAIRYVYLFVLLTHIVLAAVTPLLVIVTIVHGLRDRRDKHRRWAKITAPIWLYVSITGVIVYLMLYHL